MINQSLLQDVIDIRRDIHRHPETGFDLERTAGLVAEHMEALGLKVRTGVGISGVVADLEVRGAQHRIALRADMDALPMDEERDIPFRSIVKGKAHMCGHDAHTAMLIGAARVLCAKKDTLPNHVRFIFQPCEEALPGGAPGMIADGCLDGVTAIYGQHVWPWLDTGKIGICPGPMMAQADSFDITIYGKGGHAAAPHQCVDPIVIGSRLVGALQTLVSREVSPLDSAVLSVTRFHAGSAYNVIPSEAKIAGTVRTYSKNTQTGIKRRLKELTDGLEMGGELKYSDGYPPLINHEVSCQHAREACSDFIAASDLIFPAESAMFGEDFAYYVEKVPGCYLQLGSGNAELDCCYPLHHSKFGLDEACIPVGVRLLAAMAMRPH